MWRRALSAIFGRARNAQPYWYAIKLARCGDALERGWLVDPKAPAEYSVDFGASVWFDTPADAWFTLTRCGLLLRDHQLVRLAIRPDTNHYAMKDVAWP